MIGKDTGSGGGSVLKLIIKVMILVTALTVALSYLTIPWKCGDESSSIVREASGDQDSSEKKGNEEMGTDNQSSGDPADATPVCDAELLKKLTPEQFDVTQKAGTEPAFSGKFYKTKTPGVYRCVVCGAPLFSSEHKFDSGTGWPSYRQPFSPDSIRLKTDRSHNMVRTEVVCAKCGAHLGHLFDDGPDPTGKRYCINSLSLDLDPKAVSKDKP